MFEKSDEKCTMGSEVSDLFEIFIDDEGMELGLGDDFFGRSDAFLIKVKECKINFESSCKKP